MSLWQSIVDETPKLKRGRAWCVACGREFVVDAVKCLRSGWPTCCGATVTVDSPAERAARKEGAKC